MSPWKKRGLIALGVLVALVAAFSAGRFSKPSEVIEAHVFHTVTVEKVIEKVVEKKIEVKAKARVVYVDRVIKPDGEVHEKVTEREAEATETKTDTTAERDLEKSTDTAAKTETITKNDAPRLTVMVLAGYQHAPAVNLIPNVGPFSLGVSATYRFAGPFTAGALVTSTGGVWAGLGLQF